MVRRLPGLAGVVGAILFFCASLTPSLLPRSWIMQGVVGGIAAAIGYAVAAAGGAGTRALVRVRPGEPVRRVTWLVVLLGGSALCAVTLWRSTVWQRGLRRLMGMDDTLGWLVPLIPLVAAATFAGLLLFARLVRLAVRRLTGVLRRYMPLSVAYLGSTAIAAFMVAVLVNDFLFRGLVGVLDASSSAADSRTDRGVVRPVSPYLSGGPGTLVPWRSLGRYGRAFAGSAVTRPRLAAFTGRRAIDPIRVYTGLGSARTFDDQAALAVRELERTGAFRRKILAIMGTTGTGWVDGRVADSLEYMYGGDSALVAMQYSYLPSWASFVVDRSKAVRATRALVRAVRARWGALPPQGRPRLVVFGESLGAFGLESAFGDLDRLTTGTDGALLVGPPGFNPVWRRLTAHRDRGSPPWRPVYQQGLSVRFAQDPADLATPRTPWKTPRVVYLQNASDPVVWWSPELIYRPPGWLDRPRGPGVSRQMEWFPLVTFWQVVVDLIVARGVPPGRGHRYGANVVDGWAAVAPPPGWTDADTARLRVLVTTGGGR